MTWAEPAEGVLAALRAAGNTKTKIVTLDLSEPVALDMVKGGNVVAIVADQAYELGRAMATAAGYGLLDKPAPPFVVAPVLTVTKANVAEGWQEFAASRRAEVGARRGEIGHFDVGAARARTPQTARKAPGPRRFGRRRGCSRYVDLRRLPASSSRSSPFCCATTASRRPSNLLNIVQQTAPVTVMAVGMAFVLTAGEIDLSIGSIVAVAALLAAMVLRDWPWPSACSPGSARAPPSARSTARWSPMGGCRRFW